MKDFVTICIPTKDKSDLLVKALKSIKANTVKGTYKILILDNGSQKKIKIENASIDVTVINSPENLGFGRGLNLLINEAMKLNSETHILVLNDDVEVLPNWLSNLTSCLVTHFNAGVIGSVCLYPNGIVQHAGAFINNYYTGQHFQNIPDKAKEFEYIPFVCALLRNQFVKFMIEKEGSVFDEKILKAYSEDVDVCYSARKHGYTCLLEPTSKIIHHEGTSQKIGTLGSPQDIQALQTKNKEYVAKKWEAVDYTDPSKKYQVCFVARISGQLSYQQVLKNIAPRLNEEKDFDVSLLPEETVYSPEYLPREWELRKLRLKPFDENRICIRYTEGEYAYLAYSRDIIYSTIESWGDHIPYNWKNNINKFKQCWVTSNAVKETYQRSGITIPIKVIPHGIDFNIWDYKKAPYYNPHLPKFMFFINDMYGTRKNLDAAVCAFINCFKGNKDVGLYIQSSNLSTQLRQMGYGGDCRNVTSQTHLRKRVQNDWLNKLGWGGTSQIFINEDWIDTETLVSLYSRANAVISIGNEGFGLCGLQAIAMKKPLIYLDIGGMKDFANSDNAYPVKVGKLGPSRQHWIYQQYINGTWAEPDFLNLQYQITHVYNNPTTVQIKTDKAYADVRENFAWDNAITKIMLAIEEMK